MNKIEEKEEIWKTMIYNDIIYNDYEISNLGNIRTKPLILSKHITKESRMAVKVSQDKKKIYVGS